MAAVVSLAFAQGAQAHYVVKSLNCIPVNGTAGDPYKIDCHVSAVYNTVRNDCVCEEGFALYYPQTQTNNEDTTGTGPRNVTDG
jgi:hypothetical protein